MKEPVLVYTGEVKAGGKGTVLKSSPIGSCVVVVLFDGKTKAGVMAHIMLPGKSPLEKEKTPTRFAVNAIEEGLRLADSLQLNKNELKAIIAGGANVLKRENDTIGPDNIKSVIEILKEKGTEIMADRLGGTNRRTVRFDIENGIIYCSEGDFPENLLLQTFSSH